MYTKFEVSLPFSRTKITNFIKHVDEAEAKVGSNGYVTIDSLKGSFCTSAWNPLFKPESPLVKFLLSPNFKNYTVESMQKR